MQDSKEIKPSCHEISSQGHLYVEGELDPLRSSRLEAHLESCGRCRRAMEELSEERLWIMESIISTPRLPPRFASKVTEKIRKERERRTFRRWFRVMCAGLSLTSAAALALLTASLLSVEETPLTSRSLADSRAALQPRVTEPQAAERRAVERQGVGGFVDAGVAVSWRDGASRDSKVLDLRFAPVERNCSDDGLHDDEVDPLFPSTALVCASCADPKATVSRARSGDGLEVPANVKRPKFRDAVVLAFEIEKADTPRASAAASSSPSSSSSSSSSVEPCFRDPNADGRHDGSDVALYLQQALASDTFPAEGGLATLQAAAGEERPCEAICVGA